MGGGLRRLPVPRSIASIKGGGELFSHIILLRTETEAKKKQIIQDFQEKPIQGQVGKSREDDAMIDLPPWRPSNVERLVDKDDWRDVSQNLRISCK